MDGVKGAKFGPWLLPIGFVLQLQMLFIQLIVEFDESYYYDEDELTGLVVFLFLLYTGGLIMSIVGRRNKLMTYIGLGVLSFTSLLSIACFTATFVSFLVFLNLAAFSALVILFNLRRDADLFYKNPFLGTYKPIQFKGRLGLRTPSLMRVIIPANYDRIDALADDLFLVYQATGVDRTGAEKRFVRK